MSRLPLEYSRDTTGFFCFVLLLLMPLCTSMFNFKGFAYVDRKNQLPEQAW